MSAWICIGGLRMPSIRAQLNSWPLIITLCDVHDDSIRILDLEGDRRWPFGVIPRFAVQAFPNDLKPEFLTTACRLVEIRDADTDVQVVQHPAHMWRTGRPFVLKDAKIVVPVGQVATVPML